MHKIHSHQILSIQYIIHYCHLIPYFRWEEIKTEIFSTCLENSSFTHQAECYCKEQGADSTIAESLMVVRKVEKMEKSFMDPVAFFAFFFFFSYSPSLPSPSLSLPLSSFSFLSFLFYSFFSISYSRPPPPSLTPPPLLPLSLPHPSWFCAGD